MPEFIQIYSRIYWNTQEELFEKINKLGACPEKEVNVIDVKSKSESKCSVVSYYIPK